MNRQFPALSGLAMLLIVLNHTIEMGTKIPLRYGFEPMGGAMPVILSFVQALGFFAVPTFLFISGTFVSYAARGEPPSLTSKFLTGSVAHIGWPYLFWSVVFYAIVLVQLAERYSPAGYVKNLLVGYPFHFIPMLVLCYVVSPLLVRAARRHAAALMAVLGAAQFLLLALVHTKFLPRGLNILVPPVVGHTLADWMVYFPLGLVYGMKTREMLPWLRRFRWVLLGAAVAMFLGGFLHYNRAVNLPLVGQMSPVPLVLALPIVDRGKIPQVASLERIGKRSYGLYLTHLIVLDLVLWGIGAAAPIALGAPAVLLPVLYVVAVILPIFLMEQLARSPMRKIYRYILG